MNEKILPEPALLKKWAGTDLFCESCHASCARTKKGADID